uniref:Peptidase C1A papain C-terminal domain-containing protein n=1 Tax=Quercus lobata TaxID=97700 RepID=A0A7N2MRH3_QUELO
MKFRHDRIGVIYSVQLEIKGVVVNCCWAITATVAIEALYTLRDIDNAITPLAPQELIDCCVLNPKNRDKKGCYNYATNKAFKWIMKNGISTEEDYPFQGQKGDCKPKTKPGVSITGFEKIDDNDQIAFLKKVSEHPVAAAVHIFDEFLKLKGEIYKGPQDPLIAKIPKGVHAILVVGYDTENGEDYWMIRNSWGENWGVNGYGKILRSGRVSILTEKNEVKEFPLVHRVSYPTI